MNVEAYLQRIAYDGPRRPSADVLRALQVAHLRAVPFENLDIHLGRLIALDLARIFAKVVTARRGGFCYELNGLFAWLLTELGFDVTLLSARDAHPDGSFGREFDHLVLCVTGPADSAPWLVDVGWGDTFLEPLRLAEADVQPQGLRAYRLEQSGDRQVLWQRGDDGTWTRHYGFTIRPRSYADFTGMCWYQQWAAESHFRQNRICSRATPQGRISLDGERLIITAGGQRSVRPVADEAAYRALLAEHFGIVL